MRITNGEGKKRGLFKSVLRTTGFAAALTTLMIMSAVSHVKSAWALEGGQCVEFASRTASTMRATSGTWQATNLDWKPEAKTLTRVSKTMIRVINSDSVRASSRARPIPSGHFLSGDFSARTDGHRSWSVVGGGGLSIGIGGGGSVTNEFVNNGNINNGGQQNVNNGGNQNVNNGGVQNNGPQVVTTMVAWAAVEAAAM